MCPQTHDVSHVHNNLIKHVHDVSRMLYGAIRNSNRSITACTIPWKYYDTLYSFYILCMHVHLSLPLKEKLKKRAHVWGKLIRYKWTSKVFAIWRPFSLWQNSVCWYTTCGVYSWFHKISKVQDLQTSIASQYSTIMCLCDIRDALQFD